MKIIVCKQCRQQIRIPEDKHIRFKCPNRSCQKRYEYRNGNLVTPTLFSYAVPFFGASIVIISSFFTFLFPIGHLVGVSCLVGWLLSVSNTPWLKASASIFQASAIGFMLLLLIQLLLNIVYNSAGDNIPPWLLSLDDFLIWSRVNLNDWADVSLEIYILIMAFTLYSAFKRPQWKLVTKLTRLEGWTGKISVTLIVITSFTFFAPLALDKPIDDLYSKRYNVIYRDKLKQERRKLIAEALKEKIAQHDTAGYALKINNIVDDLKGHISYTQSASYEALQDVQFLISTIEENKAKEDNEEQSRPSNPSESYSRSQWKEDLQRWEDRHRDATAEFKKSECKVKYQNRSAFLLSEAENAKVSKLKADEAVEALKAVCAKILCGAVPKFEPLLDKYVEEFVNNVSNYLIAQTNLEEILTAVFDHATEYGKIDIFSRIGNLWQAITSARKREEEKIYALRKAKEDEVARQETEVLINKLRRRIATLEVDIPRGWEDVKRQIERQQGRIISRADVIDKITRKAREDVTQLLIYDNSDLEIKDRLNELTRNLDMVRSVKTTGALLSSIRPIGTFPICSRCHMPAIPGTPCLISFR